jgi:hypothetical protein
MKPGNPGRTAALAAAFFASALPGCRQTAHEAEIAAKKEAARLIAERAAKQAAAEQAAHAAAAEAAAAAERPALKAAESESARPGLVEKTGNELLGRGVEAGAETLANRVIASDGEGDDSGQAQER